MSKTIVKIGVDVATNSTGIAIFINDSLFNYGTIKTEMPKAKFSGTKAKVDSAAIYRATQGLFNNLRQQLLGEKFDAQKDLYEIKWEIALEQSNHANKSLATKLGVYAGIWTLAINNQINLFFPRSASNIKIKYVAPREWQLRVFGMVLDRADGKAKSIEKAKTFGAVNNLDDDAADAINIASVAHIIRDNVFVGQERHNRSTQKQRNTIKINVITTKLVRLKEQLLERKTKEYLRIKEAKKSKFDANEITKKELLYFATKTQLEKFYRYEAELKDLNADLKVIREFKIIGKTE